MGRANKVSERANKPSERANNPLGRANKPSERANNPLDRVNKVPERVNKSTGKANVETQHEQLRNGSCGGHVLWQRLHDQCPVAPRRFKPSQWESEQVVAEIGKHTIFYG